MDARTCTPVHKPDEVHAIAHKPAVLDVELEREHGRQPMASSAILTLCGENISSRSEPSARRLASGRERPKKTRMGNSRA
jgi:hypothetical protein